MIKNLKNLLLVIATAAATACTGTSGDAPTQAGSRTGLDQEVQVPEAFAGAGNGTAGCAEFCKLDADCGGLLCRMCSGHKCTTATPTPLLVDD